MRLQDRYFGGKDETCRNFLDFFPKQVPKTKELESEKTVRESRVTRKNVKTRNVLLPFETQCQRGKIQQSTPWVLHQSSTESFPCDQQFSSKWITIYSQEGYFSSRGDIDFGNFPMLY